jgi:VIT1/CCC1 family predicted Fe2+/Mn2+ transporter
MQASALAPDMNKHHEQHRIEKVGWLRAAVLGANDGIISTSSLVLGVAAAHAAHGNIVLTGIAGLVAGTMSMATGEYVSVYSQSDTEKAALAEEAAEIKADFHGEHRELVGIYMRRGLDFPLAQQVAAKLMAHDALSAHARDELGITSIAVARPLQAALASACSFASGAALPLAVALLAPQKQLILYVAIAALISLAFLGGLAAKTGGAKVLPGVLRVTFWSTLAMGVTAAVGAFFGVAT